MFVRMYAHVHMYIYMYVCTYVCNVYNTYNEFIFNIYLHTEKIITQFVINFIFITHYPYVLSTRIVRIIKSEPFHKPCVLFYATPFQLDIIGISDAMQLIFIESNNRFSAVIFQ